MRTHIFINSLLLLIIMEQINKQESFDFVNFELPELDFRLELPELDFNFFKWTDELFKTIHQTNLFSSMVKKKRTKF